MHLHPCFLHCLQNIYTRLVFEMRDIILSWEFVSGCLLYTPGYHAENEIVLAEKRNCALKQHDYVGLMLTHGSQQYTLIDQT